MIANAGQPAAGMKSAMDLFSTGGGTQLAGMVEALGQTPVGKALLERWGVKVGANSAPAAASGADGEKLSGVPDGP